MTTARKIHIPSHFSSIANIVTANVGVGEHFFTNHDNGGPLAYLAGQLDGTTLFITRQRPFSPASRYRTWRAYPGGAIVPVSAPWEFESAVEARAAIHLTELGSVLWGNQTQPVIASQWNGG